MENPQFFQFMFSQSDTYGWIILPIIIFIARICDVTLGTIRIILISRGKRSIAPFLGFFEVLIWIVVIGQLVQNIHSITAYFMYAAGFAAGNFIGMWLEDKIAIGMVLVRIILPQGGEEVAHTLHEKGYGVTFYDGEGSNGPVKLIFTIVKRKSLDDVKTIVHQYHPMAFITVEDIRSAEAGVFPVQPRSMEDLFSRRMGK